MPRTTVADLEKRVDELEGLLAQALHVNTYQTRALADVVRSNRDAHAALDKAREAFKQLNGTKPAPKQQTTARKPTGTKQYTCNVPGSTCTETHTAAELQACWMARNNARSA